MDDDDLAKYDDFTLMAEIERRCRSASCSSPPSIACHVSALSAEVRESLEGALMAILPREERLKRAVATSHVEWSHVRKSDQGLPEGTEGLFSGFH